MRNLPSTIRVHAVFLAAAGVFTLTFLLVGVIGNPGMMQEDYVHPNAAGARIVEEVEVPVARQAGARAQGPQRAPGGRVEIGGRLVHGRIVRRA